MEIFQLTHLILQVEKLRPGKVKWFVESQMMPMTFMALFSTDTANLMSTALTDKGKLGCARSCGHPSSLSGPKKQKMR